MHPSFGLLGAAALASASLLAHARDLGPQELLRLREAGLIQPLKRLDQAALALHPGSRIEETELEEEYGRYIYQVELRDPAGVRWDLELDASSGETLKNYQDD